MHKKKILKATLLVMLFFSFMVGGYATLGKVTPLLGNVNYVWRDASTDIDDIGDKNNSPISDDYSKVGFDIMFGNTREMVTYTGEIPSALGNTEGFERIPFIEGSPSTKDYFGVDIPDDAKLEDIEKLGQGQTPKSLRIYALENSQASFNLKKSIKQGAYSLTKGTAKLAGKGIQLLVMAKNIEMKSILDALQLNKVVKVFNTVFLYKDGKPSIFLIFALVSFIFLVVGTALSFARGGTKKNSLSNLVLVLVCGFMVTGMALSGRSESLATSFSNLANSLVTSSTHDMLATDMWESKDGKSVPSSATVGYNETSLINKPIIDMQIATQFGVDSIDELKVDKLKIPNKINGVDLKQFDNNLGYYFWFADSSSPVFKNGEINVESFKKNNYRTDLAPERLSNMMTAMQKGYNASDAKGKESILKMTNSLSNPAIGNGAFLFLLMTVEYIILVLALWRLALKALQSKLLVAGSTILLPIAGICLISGRKKLVDKGKMCLFIVVSCSIQIVVLSIVFDLMLYLIGIVTKANIMNLMLGVALSLMFFKFAPALNAQLSTLFTNINNAISPELNQAMNAVKQNLKNKVNGFNQWNANREVTRKIADENGNIITAKVKNGKSGLLGAVGSMTENALENPQNRKSTRALVSELRSNKLAQDQKAAEEFSRAKSRSTKSMLKNAEEYKKHKEREMFTGGKQDFNSIKQDAVSDEIKEKMQKIKFDEVSATNMQLPQDLQEKYNKSLTGEHKLTDDEKMQLEKFTRTKAELADKIKKDKDKIVQELKDQIQNDTDTRFKAELEQALVKEKEMQNALLQSTKSKIKGKNSDRLRKSIAEREALADKKLEALKSGSTDNISSMTLTDAEKTDSYHKHDAETFSDKTNRLMMSKKDLQQALEEEKKSQRVMFKKKK